MLRKLGSWGRRFDMRHNLAPRVLQKFMFFLVAPVATAAEKEGCVGTLSAAELQSVPSPPAPSSTIGAWQETRWRSSLLPRSHRLQRAVTNGVFVLNLLAHLDRGCTNTALAFAAIPVERTLCATGEPPLGTKHSTGEEITPRTAERARESFMIGDGKQSARFLLPLVPISPSRLRPSKFLSSPRANRRQSPPTSNNSATAFHPI